MPAIPRRSLLIAGVVVWLIELGVDDLLGDGVIDQVPLLAIGIQQTRGTDVIELARQSAGERMNEAERRFGEERSGGARLLQMMLDILRALRGGQR